MHSTQKTCPQTVDARSRALSRHTAHLISPRVTGGGRGGESSMVTRSAVVLLTRPRRRTPSGRWVRSSPCASRRLTLRGRRQRPEAPPRPQQRTVRTVRGPRPLLSRWVPRPRPPDRSAGEGLLPEPRASASSSGSPPGGSDSSIPVMLDTRHALSHALKWGGRLARIRAATSDLHPTAQIGEVVSDERAVAVQFSASALARRPEPTKPSDHSRVAVLLYMGNSL